MLALTSKTQALNLSTPHSADRLPLESPPTKGGGEGWGGGLGGGGGEGKGGGGDGGGGFGGGDGHV